MDVTDQAHRAYTGVVPEVERELPIDMIEGREAYQRFDSMMADLVTVPRAAVTKLRKAYIRKSLRNPSRPGPKPKLKS